MDLIRGGRCRIVCHIETRTKRMEDGFPGVTLGQWRDEEERIPTLDEDAF